MHTLASNRLYPSTIYEYKVITIDNQDNVHVSDTFQIHTPDLDLSTSFKFIATGDIVSLNNMLYIFSSQLSYLGSCECCFYACIQTIGKIA